MDSERRRSLNYTAETAFGEVVVESGENREDIIRIRS